MELELDTGHSLYRWLHDHEADAWTVDDVERLFGVRMTPKQLYDLYSGKYTITMPLFSFYRRPITNLTPAKSINILQLFKAIRSDYYRGITEQYRSLPESVRRDYKAKRFDYVTPCGTFDHRNVKGLIDRSHYHILDFDHCDPAIVKSELAADKTLDVLLMFVSPSGEGVKVIVEDTGDSEHRAFYIALTDYINRTHPNIARTLDSSGKDIARACFVCYDPDVYLKPEILKIFEHARN